jgi:hypothetical protein
LSQAFVRATPLGGSGRRNRPTAIIPWTGRDETCIPVSEFSLQPEELATVGFSFDPDFSETPKRLSPIRITDHWNQSQKLPIAIHRCMIQRAHKTSPAALSVDATELPREQHYAIMVAHLRRSDYGSEYFRLGYSLCGPAGRLAFKIQ